jgi:transcriptional regulator with XRE-family HTH domain
MQRFDLSGTLRRIRRIADLSQRQLADRCRLPQSTLAQAETGRRDLPVGALARAAELAGLRLAVLDSDGAEIRPMSPDGVRDLGGRRFPAHLDTLHTDELPGWWEHRPDRPRPWFTAHRDRAGRDHGRRRNGTPEDHHPVRPGDSPQERRAARQRAIRERNREEFLRRLAAGDVPPLEPFDCTCPPVCDELDDRSGKPVHAPECPCDCDVA